jgi:hypothetical protein
MTTLQATIRDWNTVKEAARDWVREFEPIHWTVLLVAMFVLGAIVGGRSSVSVTNRSLTGTRYRNDQERRNRLGEWPRNRRSVGADYPDRLSGKFLSLVAAPIAHFRWYQDALIRRSEMTFDSAVDMCRDLGIPEDAIDDVIESAELCNCGDEGPCQENSESIIKAAAEKYDKETV